MVCLTRTYFLLGVIFQAVLRDPQAERMMGPVDPNTGWWASLSRVRDLSIFPGLANRAKGSGKAGGPCNFGGTFLHMIHLIDKVYKLCCTN